MEIMLHCKRRIFISSISFFDNKVEYLLWTLSGRQPMKYSLRELKALIMEKGNREPQTENMPSSSWHSLNYTRPQGEQHRSMESTVLRLYDHSG